MWISSATPAELYIADKRPSLSTPTIAPPLFKRAREQSLPSPEILRGISYYIHSGNNHKSRSATPPQRSTTTAATFGQHHRWPAARSFRYLTTLTIAVKFQMSIEELTPTRRALAASFEGARAAHANLRLRETPAKAGDAHGSLAAAGHAAVKFADALKSAEHGLDLTRGHRSPRRSNVRRQARRRWRKSTPHLS